MTLRHEERCETCGQKLVRGRVGRPPLAVPVKYVLGALADGLTVTQTAKKFGISRASVYRFRAMQRSTTVPN